MRSIGLDNISIEGDLAVRTVLNFSRLEGSNWYRPEKIFTADSHNWPGDWEGRVILALTMLEQATHRKSAYLEEIMAMLPEHLNERGYFGKILPDATFDEQHFGGHSWMLRALCEYYKYRNDPATLHILEGMVRGFLLPVKGYFCRYPIVPVSRFTDPSPWILSKLQTKTKHHAETSDAGCAFIMLDGATAAYELLGWPELKEIIAEAIERFMEMDLEALNIQTHATLSACRGMIRFYELTGEKKYLDYALARFNLYKKAAWTEAFGNYNWFGAPRWTEPCAIIDSFMVASQLWQHTGDPVYLGDAHVIYYNALSHGNRINGSFGTDRCCGAHDADDNLFLSPINYETYWCCTMRGGEGLSRAVEYNFFVDGDTLIIPYFNTCSAKIGLASGSLSVKEITHYPFDGVVRFNVTESSLTAPAKIKLFIPSYSGKASLKVNDQPVDVNVEAGFVTIEKQLAAGDVIELDLDLYTYAQEAVFENSVKGYHKYFYGPMLLGRKAAVKADSDDGQSFENYTESQFKSDDIIPLSSDIVFERRGISEFYAPGADITLTPLCEVRDMTDEDTMRQVLFAEK